MRWFLGVDGGATKTRAAVADEAGRVLGEARGGSSSWENRGVQGAREELRRVVVAALGEAGRDVRELAFAAFALAGADVAADFRLLADEVVAPLLDPRVPRLVKNDSAAYLRSGLTRPFGVVINAGTGQVVLGVGPGGREVRIGGYGPRFGDWGAGGVVHERAWAAVIRDLEGRTPGTALTRLVLDQLECESLAELLDRTYRDEAQIERLPLGAWCSRLAAEGDAVCTEILTDAGIELGRAGLAAARALGLERARFQVIGVGGLLRGAGRLVREPMMDWIRRAAPGAEFANPFLEPVGGALILALEGGGARIDGEVLANLKARLGLAPGAER